jgi:hypothetical protein
LYRSGSRGVAKSRWLGMGVLQNNLLVRCVTASKPPGAGRETPPLPGAPRASQIPVHGTPAASAGSSRASARTGRTPAVRGNGSFRPNRRSIAGTDSPAGHARQRRSFKPPAITPPAAAPRSVSIMSETVPGPAGLITMEAIAARWGYVSSLRCSMARTGSPTDTDYRWTLTKGFPEFRSPPTPHPRHFPACPLLHASPTSPAPLPSLSHPPGSHPLKSILASLPGPSSFLKAPSFHLLLLSAPSPPLPHPTPKFCYEELGHIRGSMG